MRGTLTINMVFLPLLFLHGTSTISMIFTYYYSRSLDLIFNYDSWDHGISCRFTADISFWGHGYLEHITLQGIMANVLLINYTILCGYLANIIFILTVVIINAIFYVDL